MLRIFFWCLYGSTFHSQYLTQPFLIIFLRRFAALIFHSTFYSAKKSIFHFARKIIFLSLFPLRIALSLKFIKNTSDAK